MSMEEFMEEILSDMPAERLLAHLTPEQRLRDLTPEQRLRDLTAEDIKQLSPGERERLKKLLTQS